MASLQSPDLSQFSDQSPLVEEEARPLEDVSCSSAVSMHHKFFEASPKGPMAIY